MIIGSYIADFFVPELGLIFEIDGSSHDNKIDYDIERDVYMKSLGLEVFHFSDIDVKKNIEIVYDYILHIVNERKMNLSSLH